jgi:hypothetical protein
MKLDRFSKLILFFFILAFFLLNSTPTKADSFDPRLLWGSNQEQFVKFFERFKPNKPTFGEWLEKQPLKDEIVKALRKYPKFKKDLLGESDDTSDSLPPTPPPPALLGSNGDMPSVNIDLHRGDDDLRSSLNQPVVKTPLLPPAFTLIPVHSRDQFKLVFNPDPAIDTKMELVGPDLIWFGQWWPQHPGAENDEIPDFNLPGQPYPYITPADSTSEGSSAPLELAETWQPNPMYAKLLFTLNDLISKGEALSKSVFLSTAKYLPADQAMSTSAAAVVVAAIGGAAYLAGEAALTETAGAVCTIANRQLWEDKTNKNYSNVKLANNSKATYNCESENGKFGISVKSDSDKSEIQLPDGNRYQISCKQLNDELTCKGSFIKGQNFTKLN